MSAPGTVVFDLGNVLIRWDPFPAIAADVGAVRARAFLDGEFGFGAWNHAQDAGRSWDEGEQVAIAQHPHLAEEIRAYRRNFDASMLGPVDGTVPILRALLDGGVRAVALTNWSAELFPLAQERFEFLGWFDHVTVSGRVGVAKPDPAVFHRLAADADVDLSAAVFVDDSPTNVAAAGEVGLDGILFTDAPTLADALRDRGLTVPEQVA